MNQENPEKYPKDGAAYGKGDEKIKKVCKIGV